MFIGLTFKGSGKDFVIRIDLIESFAESIGYTVLKTDGRILEVRETVDEIWQKIRNEK